LVRARGVHAPPGHFYMARRAPAAATGSARPVVGQRSHVRQSSSRVARRRLTGGILAKCRLASPECAAVNENTLLSRKELAAALNVSTRTVDRWIREGTGPPATLLPSGRRRWRWGDVEVWLRQRREGG
jgi:predicted DNA-binding transcriptional regulator AlpA